MLLFCSSTSSWPAGLSTPGAAGCGRLARVDALVVVVDGDGEDLLRLVLADHVVVEEGLDLRRGGQRDLRACASSRSFSSAMMSLQSLMHSSQM